METQQMAMPAEMATQGPNPEEMAIYEQMRQQISPQEFSNEMLAGASQVDPQAVAEFTEELRGLDVSPEELDALNDLVDQILANPEQYDQLRQQFLAQGMPDDILPEQFDPYFFAALNMAVDQMIAAPTGVQAFAKGGIAELKPIAKAIASYGRNGDTMLAHITPAEARMLKRRGGSGTINPATGLPEFFLKKAFKKIGKAVKKFASSTVGRLVTTVALGFFLGPAAASFLGASSVAGVAAVSGFVGSAGSTLLAGGNLKDALKAGAIGGLTAGAGAGLMGGADAFASGSASTAGLTPGQAFQGQIDKFTGAFTPGASVQAPVPEAGAPTAGLGSNQMPVPDTAPYSELKMTGTPVKPFPEFFGDQASAAAPAADPLGNFIQQNEALRTAANTPAGGQTSLVDQAKDFYTRNTPTAIKEAATPGAQQAGAKAVADYKAQMATAGITPTDAALTNVYNKAFNTAMPGTLTTYGPTIAAGTGIMALAGGFKTKPVEGGDITKSLMKPVTQRIREGGTQRQMYMQGLPGVVYDEFGAPVFGQSTRLPTYDVPDYDYGGFNMSGAAAGGQGGMSLPPIYNTPSGSIGSRQVAQPYNTSSMYTNIMPPQGYAEGGTVTDLYRTVLRRDPSSAEIDNWKGQFGDSIDEKERALFREAAGAELAVQKTAREAEAATQKANRTMAAEAKALKRSQGSGQMYANINAGISALAPETNPINSYFAANPDVKAAYTSSSSPLSQAEFARQHFSQYGKTEGRADPASYGDELFGARNRAAAVAQRQAAYAPMLQGQRTAMDQQAGIAASGQLPRNVSGYSGQDKAELYRGLARQGLTDAQIRAAAENRYGMQTDADWRGLQNIVTPPVAQPPGGPITTMPIAPPVTQPPVDVVGPITPSPIAPPGDTETIRINPPPPDFSDDPGARVGPGMSMGDFNHFGIDEYGRKAGEGFGTAPPPGMQPIYQPGPAPSNAPRARSYKPATAMPITAAANPYSNITNPGAGYTGPNLYSQALAAGLLPTGEDKMAAYQRLTQQGATDPQIRNAAETMFGPQSNANWNALSGGAARFMNMGGIATLAQGGYPRRTGQINGPGTEKSDSIPAMLSDGEFVMTAKAVRGAGKGSRRAGAKQMYKLMHQLEKNSERG
jgi:hypothetical protein